MLSRKRIAVKYGVTAESIGTVIDLFLVSGEAVEPIRHFALCRDPKDDIFLDIAVSGNADAIVSGDQDLLTIHPFENIPILPPRAVLEWIGAV